jgi:outer membrane immunogenic protein
MGCDTMHAKKGKTMNKYYRMTVGSGLGVLASLALSAVTFAADAPPSSRPVVKAPPAATSFNHNWSGLYVGGHVGYGWGDKDWSDPVSGETFLSQSIHGFLGGGQIGYDHQMGQFVFGVAADLSGAALRKTSPFPDDPTISGTSKVKSLGTATVRAGFAMDRALIYILGGGAWARDRFTVADSIGSVSTSQSRGGWTVGGGGEIAIDNNWSAFLQYNYLDFGNKEVTFPGLGIAKIDQTVHVVKFGVNLRLFGGDGGLVSAKN